MENNQLIIDKDKFEKTAGRFLNTIFNAVLSKNFGDIEIRVFPKDSHPEQYFCSGVHDSTEIAYNLCNSGIDVYFGVNPRTGKVGKKENVHYLTSFHTEIDYGVEGHKKIAKYKTYNEAIKVICDFPLQPTWINLSGGGLHCYWVLKDPVKVETVGVGVLESINKNLTLQLGGDTGTQDISRVLRVPGTFNFKLENNPREVKIVSSDGPKYDFEQFKEFIKVNTNTEKDPQPARAPEPIKTSAVETWDGMVETLPVSERIKSLILHGNDGTYNSRSEADQAVITSLITKGVSEFDIKKIFKNYLIGEKYREHKSPDAYLKHNIDQAMQFSNLTEDEIQDPLFISGALRKTEKRYHLDVVRFQEHMVKKYKLKFLEKEKTIFQYNGKCYEECTEEALNHICQQELKNHRHLFAKSTLTAFIHYFIGDKLIDSQKAQKDQIKYLTLQNGLYNLNDETVIAHTADIFTTNLLPYDFDPDAKCIRFLKYLNEVFLGDKETIDFIQESIGYAFYKSIPKPAIFFLIGSGSNGKSVFIDTITNLFGEENASSISLNSLANEYYILELFGKMINISSETPHKKQINTDKVKAAVAGDWITGREPYKQPKKFKPFAKHYLAMNEIPLIDDSSHGMWRRLYLIEFPRTFSEDEMDVYLTEKLKKELSGIFNWALEGYERLREKNFIFSEGKSMVRSKQNYKDQSNSVFAFAAQHFLKAGADDRVKFKDVYDHYRYFCENEGYVTSYTKKDFKNTLQSAGYNITRSSKDGNQIVIFEVKFLKDVD